MILFSYCLELCEKQPLRAPNTDAIILDGFCLNASSWNYKNFSRFCRHCVLVHIMLTQLQNVEGGSTVWDVYMEDTVA